jgi:hypothetical protein
MAVRDGASMMVWLSRASTEISLTETPWAAHEIQAPRMMRQIPAFGAQCIKME